MNHKKSRGNVLFLILIAVALFAALSYAVTQSTRSGGGDTKSESATTKAAAMMQFFAALDTGIMRLNLSKGVPIENISFEYVLKRYGGTTATSFVNANCTSEACKLFSPSGGGVSPVTFVNSSVANPTGWTSGLTAPGYYDFALIQWSDAGTASNDIVIKMIGINPDVCLEINKKLGITVDPALSGTFLLAAPVSNWNNSAQTCSSGCAVLSANNTVARYISSNNYCEVYHLLIKR